MSWTTPADLRAQVRRLWERGELLAGISTGQAFVPRRLRLKTPSSGELLDRFDEARKWSASIREMRHVRVELRTFRHRVFGENELPAEVWIDSREAACAVCGTRHEAATFAELTALTRTRRPALLEWADRRSLRMLELAEAWPRLLDVVDWLEAHPRPGVYLREVDLAGVDTKFIEAHRPTLAELFDVALPGALADADAMGVSGFARRYGFREKPVRIRFRILDSAVGLGGGLGTADTTLDADSFRSIECGATRIFITENETNFLAFPFVLGGMVIFGAGYGFETLGRVDWLRTRRIFYWGDIDTHGFAILDQLRSHLGPAVDNLLMDSETLETFRDHWGREPTPTNRDLPRLTEEERQLYDVLRDNRIRPNLRLEQERVGYEWLKARLARVR